MAYYIRNELTALYTFTQHVNNNTDKLNSHAHTHTCACVCAYFMLHPSPLYKNSTASRARKVTLSANIVTKKRKVLSWDIKLKLK